MSSTGIVPVKEIASTFPFHFGVAPYFSYDTTVYLLARHFGGHLIVSQFDRDEDANFEFAEVSKVRLSAPAETSDLLYVDRLTSCRAHKPECPSANGH